MPNTQLRADIFPANISLERDGEVQVHHDVRIVITLDHVYVFKEGQPAPVLVFDDRLTSYTPPVRATRVRRASQTADRSAYLETEDGYKGTFLRGGSCGCGSRLKTFKVDNLLQSDNLTSAASTGDSA